ncbi:MAG: glycogen/starch synthase [Bacteroidota bacterium]
MTKAKVLFVFQEITPYLPDSHLANIGRHLPQGIQERGKEIRTFMPRFGCINERRNQLHEVIRLSGMNIIIDDTDHPLIIKVASVQAARLQIYFIDNEDYFQRKYILHDKNNEFFKDNDERAVFYSRGVLETVKKLGWAPDIIHCHGWLSSLIPFYVKNAYRDNPLFQNTKIVYSVYNDDFTKPLEKDFDKKIWVDGVSMDDLANYKNSDFVSVTKNAIDYSDAVIIGQEKVNPEIISYLNKFDKPVLKYQSSDEYIDNYSDLYDEVMAEATIMSE